MSPRPHCQALPGIVAECSQIGESGAAGHGAPGDFGKSSRYVGIPLYRGVVAVVREGGLCSSAGRCAVADRAVGARVWAEVARRQRARQGSECLNTAAGFRTGLCSRLSLKSRSEAVAQRGGCGAQGAGACGGFQAEQFESVPCPKPDGRVQQAQRGTRSRRQVSRRTPERLHRSGLCL